MWGYYYKLLHNQKRISIKDGILSLKKTLRTYKDFGKSFYEVWLENFFNYSSILISLFALSMSVFNVIFNFFYNNILQLS